MDLIHCYCLHSSRPTESTKLPHDATLKVENNFFEYFGVEIWGVSVETKYLSWLILTPMKTTGQVVWDSL